MPSPLLDSKDDPSGSRATTQDSPVNTIMEFLAIVTRYRRVIVRIVFVMTVGAVGLALALPKWYKSTATVLPAEKTDLLGGLEGVASFAKSISGAKALSALGSNPEMDRYLAILKSGRVFSEVISKFDLVNVYGITQYPGEKTAKELMSNVEFSVEPEGTLSISVYDKDPQRAAEMTNFFVDMLNRTNSEVLAQNAKGNRSFVEERYNKNLQDLRAAEDSLQAFQKRYGVVSMPEQVKATIEAGATLLGQVTLKEVQLGVLRRTTAVDNPAVQTLKAEIEELHHKLNDMNTGGGLTNSGSKIFVPFNNMPDWGLDYLRRYREVEIQYKILQYVMPLYEQAKVEERRDTPSVLVLDRAAPAERKAKPKAMLFGLIGLVVGLVISLAVVFTLELHNRLRKSHPGAYEKELSILRNDWFGLRFWRKS